MPHSFRLDRLLALVASLIFIGSCSDVPTPTGREAAPSCGSGQAPCAGECVEVDSHPDHCGACGANCDESQVCVRGSCKEECPPGQEPCDGRCVDTDGSGEHCGGCGDRCDEGSVCSGGKCSEQCRGTQPHACGGNCTHLDRDPRNCGACGRSCDLGEVCSSGECVSSCGGATPLACDGYCVDPRTDPLHCGACGESCPGGSVCSGGECKDECDAPLTRCGDVCVDTSNDPGFCGDCTKSCSAGEHCVAGTCREKCPAGTAASCGSACADWSSDRLHCGGCNTRCDEDEVCSAGLCSDECSGLTPLDCGGRCVDPFSDPNACGNCETSCMQGQVCAEGRCQDECPDGLAECDGRCVDLSVDPRHCGTCGQGCVMGAVCAAGICASECPTDRPTQCASTCVNLDSNERHCGECGTVCLGDQTCQSGRCVCPEDSRVCNGVCVDTDVNEKHCGGCDQACPAAQTCQEGVCRCAESEHHALCNDTCVDLLESDAHCGDCERACPAAQTCQEGVCRCAESEHHALCNDTCVDLLESDAHCGDCQNGCSATENCEAGICFSRVIRVETGWTNACSLYEDGAVRCWGRSGPPTGKEDWDETSFAIAWIEGFSAQPLEIAVGGNHGCVLQSDGKVACWGSNYKNILGVASPSDVSPTPVMALLPPERTGVAIALEANHSAAILDDGSLWTWGDNISSALGHTGNMPDSVALDGAVVAVRMEQSHMCARLSAADGGQVLCWGNQAELGHETSGEVAPTVVSGLTASDDQVDLSRSLAVGKNFNCAIVGQGDVECWGHNQYGELGVDPETTARSTTPLPISGLPARAVEIRAGKEHACALLSTEELWCWGNHRGPDITLPSPTPEKLAESVLRFSADNEQTYALTRNGDWLSWGEGSTEQLLGRSSSNTSTPTACCEW